jgi:hypothetical protein
MCIRHCLPPIVWYCNLILPCLRCRFYALLVSHFKKNSATFNDYLKIYSNNDAALVDNSIGPDELPRPTPKDGDEYLRYISSGEGKNIITANEDYIRLKQLTVYNSSQEGSYDPRQGCLLDYYNVTNGFGSNNWSMVLEDDSTTYFTQYLFYLYAAKCGWTRKQADYIRVNFGSDLAGMK